MKRFEFTLDRVLEWRTKQVSVEEGKLEALHGELRSIEERRAALTRDRTENEALVLQDGVAEASELRSLDDFRRYVRYQCVLLDRESTNCDARIAAQRERVRTAQRDAQLLERLKQNRRVAWKSDFDKELEEQAAEAYLAKWAASAEPPDL